MLGEGGMGAVYRATQLSLNRIVALKVLATELSDDETFRERFRREGLLQAAIDHPHIVTVYEAGETDQGLFLAMRLVRGPTLKDEILSNRLKPERTIHILLAVAEALDAAHEVGLIHRDVKPQNILVGARDHAYLADFGLTKVPDESVALTGTGQFVGTIDYISPEQVRGEGADHRSDVYALAGVLYECLTGNVPFARPSEAAVLFAHMSDPPPSLREARPELPAELDELIARGMAKNPDERFSSAGELMRNAAQAMGMAATGTLPAQAAAPGDQATRPSAPAFGEATVARHAVTAPAGTQPAPAAAETVKAGGVAAPKAPAAQGVSGGLLAVGAAVLVVAAVVGYLAGSSGSSGSESEPDFANSASAGAIGLSFPADWERASESPDIPGLRLSDAMTLGPTGESANTLTAGTAARVGPTLLPRGLERRLSGDPEGEPVRIGELEAYRYEGLRPRGSSGALTLYVVPTSGGVATAACRAESAAATDFLARCEEVAATLELSGVEPLALGPSEDYARTLNGALRKLDGARRSQGAKLRNADTPPDQAEAAEALSRAYGAAARTLADAPAGPAERGTNVAIVSSTRRLRQEYARLATAAEDSDGDAYGSASKAIENGEKRLARSLDALSRLGYEVS